MGIDLYPKWGEKTKDYLPLYPISWISVFIYLHSLHIWSSVLSAQCTSYLHCSGQELAVLGFSHVIIELLSNINASLTCR